MPQVTAAVELLALTLRGGVGLVDSVELVARGSPEPVRGDLTLVATAVRWGVPWSQAWLSVGPDWDIARRATMIADAAGIAPTGPLRRAAQDARGRHTRGVELAAARLGVRIVLPLGLAFLPAFVLLTVVPLVVALAGQLW